MPRNPGCDAAELFGMLQGNHLFKIGESPVFQVAGTSIRQAVSLSS
jgi:hypothetical protein